MWGNEAILEKKSGNLEFQWKLNFLFILSKFLMFPLRRNFSSSKTHMTFYKWIEEKGSSTRGFKGFRQFKNEIQVPRNVEKVLL